MTTEQIKAGISKTYQDDKHWMIVFSSARLGITEFIEIRSVGEDGALDWFWATGYGGTYMTKETAIYIQDKIGRGKVVNMR